MPNLNFWGDPCNFFTYSSGNLKNFGGGRPPPPEPSGSTPECKPHLAPTQGTNNTSQKADLRVNGSNNKEYNNNKHKKTKEKVK